MRSIPTRNKVLVRALPFCLVAVLLSTSAPVVAENEHCADFTITNYNPQSDQELKLVVNRPGTEKTKTVDIESDGTGWVCLESAWQVSDVYDNEPVSVRLTWSNPDQTTVAQVDVDVLQAVGTGTFSVLTPSTWASWSIAKQFNALVVGDEGLKATAQQQGVTLVADYNPTRHHTASNPWVITTAMSGLTSNFAYVEAWYNAPLHDQRGGQVPKNPNVKYWYGYVWYTLDYSGAESPQPSIKGLHNWPVTSGVAIPADENDFPFVYDVENAPSIDPGIRLGIQNPSSSSSLWKCDNPLLGECHGPDTYAIHYKVTLTVEQETRQYDQQMHFEQTVDGTTLAHDSETEASELYIQWGCVTECIVS